MKNSTAMFLSLVIADHIAQIIRAKNNVEEAFRFLSEKSELLDNIEQSSTQEKAYVALQSYEHTDLQFLAKALYIAERGAISLAPIVILDALRKYEGPESRRVDELPVQMWTNPQKVANEAVDICKGVLGDNHELMLAEEKSKGFTFDAA